MPIHQKLKLTAVTPVLPLACTSSTASEYSFNRTAVKIPETGRNQTFILPIARNKYAHKGPLIETLHYITDRTYMIPPFGAFANYSLC